MFEIGVSLGEKVDKIHGVLSKPPKNAESLSIHKTVGGSGVTVASGFGDYALVVCSDFPSLGKTWELRAIHCYAGPGAAATLAESAAGAFVTGQTSISASTSVAAAAAGSLTLTGFSYVSSWRIDPAAAWPAGTNQVTITNLNGGTQTYDLPGGTTNPLIVPYPGPSSGLAAPFGVPVISVPAIVGGPAFTINAIGISLGNGVINSAADIYSGQPPMQGTPPSQVTAPSLFGAIRTDVGPMPFHEELPRYTYWVKGGQQLFAVFNAIPGAGTACVFVAQVNEWNTTDIEAMYV